MKFFFFKLGHLNNVVTTLSTLGFCLSSTIVGIRSFVSKLCHNRLSGSTPAPPDVPTLFSISPLSRWRPVLGGLLHHPLPIGSYRREVEELGTVTKGNSFRMSLINFNLGHFPIGHPRSRLWSFSFSSRFYLYFRLFGLPIVYWFSFKWEVP